jgi:hypothetical protein
MIGLTHNYPFFILFDKKYYSHAQHLYISRKKDKSLNYKVVSLLPIKQNEDLLRSRCKRPPVPKVLLLSLNLVTPKFTTIKGIFKKKSLFGNSRSFSLFFFFMFASSARNSARLFNSRASLGVYRHRAVITCAGIHTTRKSKGAVP